MGVMGRARGSHKSASLPAALRNRSGQMVSPRSGTNERVWPERFTVIGGAPRCGTTSLSKFLAAHPDVCFSSVKETHFLLLNDLLDADERTLRQAIADDYLPRYFADCPTDSRLWAEGSVSFIYSPEAARQLLRVWPDTRFVITLRDPMEMLPSLHERNLYQGDETVEDFAEAWHLTPRRARGEAIPPSCFDSRMLRYDEAAKLGTYLGRLLEAVGVDRCHTIVHDDIVTKPAKVISELYRFLDLSHDGRNHLPRVRDGRGYRSATLQRLLKRPPKALRGALAGRHHHLRVKPIGTDGERSEGLFNAVFRIRKALLRLNTVPSRRRPLSAEMQREIRDVFEDDVARLARLLDRDLSHWLTVQSDEIQDHTKAVSLG